MNSSVSKGPRGVDCGERGTNLVEWGGGVVLQVSHIKASAEAWCKGQPYEKHLKWQRWWWLDVVVSNSRETDMLKREGGLTKITTYDLRRWGRL